jgi:hypothetical protein
MKTGGLPVRKALLFCFWSSAYTSTHGKIMDILVSASVPGLMSSWVAVETAAPQAHEGRG